MYKSDLQGDLFRAHQECKVDDVQRRKMNRVYCKWLDYVSDNAVQADTSNLMTVQTSL